MRTLQGILIVSVMLFLISLTKVNSRRVEHEDDVKMNETENGKEDDQKYVDNRIDQSPTYISPVENLIKILININHGIARPIQQVIDQNPTGRAIRNGFGPVLNTISERFKAIFPGTDWCGAGDIAKNTSDVGIFSMTDSCCRTHDHCKNSISAGEAEHGLRNNGIFTRSNCQCDTDFYHCLKQVRTIISMNIGVTYFNILRPQCFKLDYPAHCLRYESTRSSNRKCLQYDYDRSKEKTWQWFDNPDYISIKL